MEFGEDDGENYTQTRRINLLINDTGFGSSVSASAVPTQSSTPLEQSRLYGKDARSLHFKIGQLILQKLVTMVLKELCPGDLLFQHNVALLTKTFWVRYCKKSYNHTSPTILDLYVLIYLAMKQLDQHPVYVDDFLSLLQRNKTPYINGATLVPKSLLRQTNLATRLFSASSIPMDNQFNLKIAQLALVVAPLGVWKTSLELFYPGAFRVFTDLSFKDAPRLLTMFHRIGFRVTGSKVLSSWRQHNTLPETQFVALLVLIIKIYFTAASEVPQIDAWIAHLEAQADNIPCFDTKHHSMSLSSALALSAEDTSKYFDWIQSNLIPESRRTENEDLPLTSRKLYNIFPLEDVEVAEKMPAPRPFTRLVKNTLTAHQILLISEHLQKYLCTRFGLKHKTLFEAIERVELKLYRALKADGAIIK